MSRAQRLRPDQVLRRHRHPVSGATRQVTGVSLRTLLSRHRTLEGRGAHIDGEAGVGYVLRPGFAAALDVQRGGDRVLVLGSRLVHQRADRALADAAANVLARSVPCCPGPARRSTIRIVDRARRSIAAGDATAIRQAIRTERKIGLYRDNNGADSKRTMAVRELREGAGGGMVQCARTSPFPHRPYRRAEHDREALSAPPPGHAQGMARA